VISGDLKGQVCGLTGTDSALSIMVTEVSCYMNWCVFGGGGGGGTSRCYVPAVGVSVKLVHKN